MKYFSNSSKSDHFLFIELKTADRQQGVTTVKHDKTGVTDSNTTAPTADYVVLILKPTHNSNSNFIHIAPFKKSLKSGLADKVQKYNTKSSIKATIMRWT